MTNQSINASNANFNEPVKVSKENVRQVRDEMTQKLDDLLSKGEITQDEYKKAIKALKDGRVMDALMRGKKRKCQSLLYRFRRIRGNILNYRF